MGHGMRKKLRNTCSGSEDVTVSKTLLHRNLIFSLSLNSMPKEAEEREPENEVGHIVHGSFIFPRKTFTC